MPSKQPTSGESVDPACLLPQSLNAEIPHDALKLSGLRCMALAHRLGYFRDERFVIFGYCPGGCEVIWKDGHSSGFASGGWRIFLDELAPIARHCGGNIGSDDSIGTHVLLMDRTGGTLYAVPRRSAESFLAQIHGIPFLKRPCLCTMLNCASCPVRTCPLAGSTHGPNFESKIGNAI